MGWWQVCSISSKHVVSSAAFSPTGNFIVGACGKLVKIWNAITGVKVSSTGMLQSSVAGALLRIEELDWGFRRGDRGVGRRRSMNLG